MEVFEIVLLDLFLRIIAKIDVLASGVDLAIESTAVGLWPCQVSRGQVIDVAVDFILVVLVKVLLILVDFGGFAQKFVCDLS